MKTKVKEQVLEFMKAQHTSYMSSNQFVWEFIFHHDRSHYYNFEEAFLKWPSVESILRSRRMIIANYWIGKRTDADSEQAYVKEFARTNKIHVV